LPETGGDACAETGAGVWHPASGTAAGAAGASESEADADGAADPSQEASDAVGDGEEDRQGDHDEEGAQGDDDEERPLPTGSVLGGPGCGGHVHGVVRG
jgi:hypothetical protein